MEQPEILFEDAFIFVVRKPAGMSSQDDSLSAMDMVSWLKNYLVREKKAGADPYVAVVHRLDRPVGGVMVYAKTKEAAAKLSEQIRKGQMDKRYLAVLTGIPDQREGVLEDILVKGGKNLTVVAQKGSPQAGQGKKAKLEYKVLRSKYEGGQQYALADIHLITGRHHQIRVQMNHLGCGLWGDSRYNPLFQKAEGRHALALFAYELSFKHPITGKTMKFSAKPGEAITDHFS